MPTEMPVQYLGVVRHVWASRRGDPYHHATVEPLVESDPASNEWIGPIVDAEARFPKRGRVHWHDVSPDLQIGSIWQFTIREKEDTRPEQYQLQQPREPLEVVDLRGWSDETALRSVLTSDGIHLAPAPLSKRCLLWLVNDICVGPLLLKSGTESGLWVIDGPEAHRDAARMPTYRLSVKDINRVPIAGEHWFLSPRLEQLAHVAGIQNWMPDEQVARSILGRLRKMDGDAVKAIGMTDRLFREYLDHVEAGKFGSVDPTVERARADRLRGVRDAIQRDVALLTEAAKALLSTSEVAAQVERQVQTKIEEEVRSRQAGIDAALASTTEQLALVRKDLDAKLRECGELDVALVAKRRELETTVASFDQEVSSRLKEIVRRPEAAFAESAIMRALLMPSLAKPLPDEREQLEALASLGESGAIGFGSSEPTTELGDDAAVRTALAAHAGAAAISVHSMLGLHASFVTGAVPIVTGARAYDLMRAYASAVAGGRLHWIPIGSSTMEPLDLLGRADPASRRIVPSPSGLLGVVRHASRSGRLHVVVLEGFNRAPTEAYLSPILEVAEASRLGDPTRKIPIASIELLANHDPYRELFRLSWPPNVLVACIPTDGSVTLPVPRSVWRFLALLDADDRERSPMPAPKGATAANVEIAPTLWKAMIDAARISHATEKNGFTALARALSLTNGDVVAAIQLQVALTHIGLPHADATALAVGAILIPRSGADERTIEEAMRASGVTATGWRNMFVEAARLRS